MDTKKYSFDLATAATDRWPKIEIGIGGVEKRKEEVIIYFLTLFRREVPLE